MKAEIIGSTALAPHTGEVREGTGRNLLLMVEGERAVRIVPEKSVREAIANAGGVEAAMKRYEKIASAVAMRVAESPEQQKALAEHLRESRPMDLDLIAARDAQEALRERLEKEARLKMETDAARADAFGVYRDLARNSGYSETVAAQMADRLDAQTEDIIESAKYWAQRKNISVGEAFRLAARAELSGIAQDIGSPEEIAARERDAIEGQLGSALEELQTVRGELRKVEARMQGFSPKTKEWSKLAQDANRWDQTIPLIAAEVARLYAKLNPDADRETVLNVIEEAAGEKVILGQELAGIKTRAELDARKTDLEDMIEALEADPETEALADAVEPVLRVKTQTIASVEGIWDADPATAKQLLAKAEAPPKSAEDIRASTDYTRLSINYERLPKDKKAEFVLTLRKHLAAGEHEGAAIPEDLMDVLEQFHDDLMEHAERERDIEAMQAEADLTMRQEKAAKARERSKAEELKQTEETFFATGEAVGKKHELDRAGRELNIGDAANVKYFFKNFEAYREILRTSDDPADREIADMTLEQFMQLPDQDPLPKGLWAGLKARVKRLTSPPGPTPRQRAAQQMQEAMNRNQRAMMSEEDLARSADRAHDLRMRQQARWDRSTAPRSLGGMSFGASPRMESYTSRRERTTTDETEQSANEDIYKLSPDAESDAIKSARAYEDALTKTKDAKAIRKMTKLIETFEEKDQAYRDALDRFYDALNMDEAKQQAEDAGEQFDYMASLAGYRKVFANIMKEMRQSPAREEFEERLNAAGIKSFDDIVIASTNKRKFKKAWDTYTKIAQELSAGAGGLGRTAVANREPRSLDPRDA